MRRGASNVARRCINRLPIQSTTSSTATDENIVEALRRELSEAHRRAAATAEVVKLIGRSHDQLQPVFDAIVAMARQLCQADYALIFRFWAEQIAW
jgi:hypothetical protein